MMYCTKLTSLNSKFRVLVIEFAFIYQILNWQHESFKSSVNILPFLLIYKLMFTRLKIKSYEFLEMQPVSQPTEQNSVHLQKQQILNWSFPPFLEFWMRPGSFYIGIVKNVCWTHAIGFILVNTSLRILLAVFLMLNPSSSITWITPGPASWNKIVICNDRLPDWICLWCFCAL